MANAPMKLKRRKIIYFVLLVILFLSFLAYPLINPQIIESLQSQPMEYTSIEQSTWALALFAAFFSLIAASLLKRSNQKNTAWLTLGIFFLFIALEEISWGGRFLLFKYPVIFGEIVDGIHDIPFVVRRTIYRDFLFYQKFIIALAIITSIILFLRWKNNTAKRFLRIVSDSLPAKTVSFGCLLLLLSQVIDIQIIPNPFWVRSWLSYMPPTYVEEFLECLASISFVLASIEKLFEIRFPIAARPVQIDTAEAAIAKALE